MLKIRQEQFQALGEQRHRQFVAALAAHLRQRYPDVTAPFTQPILEKIVDRGTRRAQQYGIQTQAMCAAFVELMFATAPDFDDYPRVRQVLTDNRYSPESRLELLPMFVPEREWQRIIRRSSAPLWRAFAEE
jgi:hypothetical protein